MTICESVVLTLLLLIFFVALGYSVYGVIFQNYNEHKKFGRQEHATKVSFKTFIDWYSLNPEEWGINNFFNAPYRLEHRKYDSSIRHYVIFAKYSDWKKYIKWLAQQEKAKEQQKQLQSEATLMRIVLTDIEKIKEKAEKEMQEAKEIMNNMGV